MGTIARHESIIRIRSGRPLGPFAWTQNVKSRRAPDGFRADPSLIALGHALAARITEATRLTTEASAAAGLFELASGLFRLSSHKARAEDVVRGSGLRWAIVRPTLTFGAGDIFINNIAWLIRRMPVFVIPGAGTYRVQPVAA